MINDQYPQSEVQCPTLSLIVGDWSFILGNIDPFFAREGCARPGGQERKQALSRGDVQRGSVLGNLERLDVTNLGAALAAVGRQDQLAVAVGQRLDATTNAL